MMPLDRLRPAASSRSSVSAFFSWRQGYHCNSQRIDPATKVHQAQKLVPAANTAKNLEIMKLKLESEKVVRERDTATLPLKFELEKWKKDNEIRQISKPGGLEQDNNIADALQPPPPVVRFLRTNDARFLPPRAFKPLRILFCGSDEMSIESLRALHAQHVENPELIKSIDVLFRPAKRSGRSMTELRELPIKAVAEELGLTTHERDTFTGWDLPYPDGEPINLIIAVSFGLFIPPRVLKAAEYGGLNVHPSQLPQYRGPSPLQHTIMDYCKYAGITVQTLDDKSFDHGIILRQTSVRIPDHERITYPDLVGFIAPKAARLLVQSLRERIFLPPLLTRLSPKILPKRIKRAPKITSEDRKIRFNSPEVAWQAPARARALGRLWSNFLIAPGKELRLVFDGIERVERPELLTTTSKVAKELAEEADDGKLARELGPSVTPSDGYEPLEIRLQRKRIHFAVPAKPPPVDPSLDIGLKPVFYINDEDSVIFAVRHGALRVRHITVEGQPKRDAKTAMKGIRKSWVWRLKLEEHPVEPRKDIWRVEPAGLNDKREWLEQKAQERYDSGDGIFAAAGF
ncbi:uncharacterized protein L3040_001329 [Drepanopeziza brunnea f. sp. 'multigermtubi']|nr:hypothetical protein L3040_001329 [Drepanopeziza brunnea f. sp. 'multigermtubi']